MRSVTVGPASVTLHSTVTDSGFRRSSKRVRELWWLGLPPGVRGEVWRKALGNDLNVSPGEEESETRSLSLCDCFQIELYRISLARCQEKLASMKRHSKSGE